MVVSTYHLSRTQLSHDREYHSSHTRSCTRRAPILVQEGNISSYRQVAIAVPGRYSLARQDGLFMSEADLQARKRSSRSRHEKLVPLVLDKNRAFLSRAIRKQVVLSRLSLPPVAFLYQCSEQCNRIEGSKADALAKLTLVES